MVDQRAHWHDMSGRGKGEGWEGGKLSQVLSLSGRLHARDMQASQVAGRTLCYASHHRHRQPQLAQGATHGHLLCSPPSDRGSADNSQSGSRLMFTTSGRLLCQAQETLKTLNSHLRGLKCSRV